MTAELNKSDIDTWCRLNSMTLVTNEFLEDVRRDLAENTRMKWMLSDAIRKLASGYGRKVSRAKVIRMLRELQ